MNITYTGLKLNPADVIRSVLHLARLSGEFNHRVDTQRREFDVPAGNIFRLSRKPAHFNDLPRVPVRVLQNLVAKFEQIEIPKLKIIRCRLE